MAYSIPPKEKANSEIPTQSLLATRQIPLLWEFLCERWKTDLKNVQQFLGKLSAISTQKLLVEEAQFAAEYLRLESYFERLSTIEESSDFQDNGFSKYLHIVEEMKENVAAVIVMLQIEQRKRRSQEGKVQTLKTSKFIPSSKELTPKPKIRL
jgi:hypothetical protein